MADPGYDFTPLPDRVNRARREQARFDRRVKGCLSGRVEITYRAQQPIHVGAGTKVMLGGTLTRAAMRRGGQLVVPGASFKGMVRARYEAITRACIANKPMGGQQRRIKSSSFDGWTVELTRAAESHDAFRACRPGREPPYQEQLCPACALFGLMSLRSRVSFDDLLTEAKAEVGKMPPQFGPRLHHCGEFTADPDRRVLKVSKVHGRKFHGGRGPAVERGHQAVEVIPAGSMLKGSVRVINLTPAEMGGLMSALGLLPGSPLKAGGGKPHGFGRIAASAVEFVLKDDARRRVGHNPPAWREAFTTCADYHEAGEQRLIATHNRGGF